MAHPPTPRLRLTIGWPARLAFNSQNLNPKWDGEVFQLLLRGGGGGGGGCRPAETVRFEVFDYDLGSSDVRLLGLEPGPTPPPTPHFPVLPAPSVSTR